MNFKISNDEYLLLSNRSSGNVRGIGNFVWVGKPSKEDITYIVLIEKIYKDLGIEDYIQEQIFK